MVVIDYDECDVAVLVKSDQSGYRVVMAIHFEDVAELEIWRDVLTSIIISQDYSISYDEEQDDEIWQELSLFDKKIKHRNVMTIFFETNSRILLALIGVSLVLLSTKMISGGKVYLQKIDFVNDEILESGVNDEDGA